MDTKKMVWKRYLFSTMAINWYRYISSLNVIYKYICFGGVYEYTTRPTNVTICMVVATQSSTWLALDFDSWAKSTLPETNILLMEEILHQLRLVVYTPENLTWNPKMEVWKMKFHFNWVIFRFHVSFRGCIPVFTFFFYIPGGLFGISEPSTVAPTVEPKTKLIFLPTPVEILVSC